MRNPGVNVVLFTGSYDVGRRIQQVSAEHYDRIVACEMGSKSAVIVCEDARLDLAVTCGHHQRLQDQRPALRLGRAASWWPRRSSTASPRSSWPRPSGCASAIRSTPANFTGPVIHRGAVEKVLSYNDLAKKEGAEVLLDGGRMTRRRARATAATCRRSSTAWSTGRACAAIREEVFGPHLALIPFKTNEDAVRIYNDTDYGLSMAVITEDYRAMRYFRDECEYGMGYVNLPCIGAEVHLPFGGVKKSGNGHPSAAGLIEAVTHKTAWTVNHGTEVKMAQGLTTEISRDEARRNGE